MRSVDWNVLKAFYIEVVNLFVTGICSRIRERGALVLPDFDVLTKDAQRNTQLSD
jgi:hypothetical protein